MTKYDNVIVFGPTGAVGGAAALEASKRGAKVWLAMRDTEKAIDGVPAAQEGAGGAFTRVKADLNDPASVTAAVKRSEAKAAFVYLVMGPPGAMRAALQAMRDAGIEYVVFLSSFTIKPHVDLRTIPPHAFIPYAHAQGELALADLGIAHTALRPAAFASNPFKMAMDTSKTPAEIYVYGTGARPLDNIVPRDIGRVAGAVLVERPSESEKEVIYLYGPKMSTELKTCEVVRDQAREEIKIVQQSSEEWTATMRKKGFPEPLLKYFADVLEHPDGDLFSESIVKEGTANIKKYSGYEPTSFEDFLRARTNK